MYGIERLMGAKRNSREGDRLDVLVTLVEAYESKHYRFDLPDPIEAIKFAMEPHTVCASIRSLLGARSPGLRPLRWATAPSSFR
jgi:antitoxin component HigA of HigAB toxin-antitoxin module